MIHRPVLKKEVIEILAAGPNKNFIDATIGEGGHTIEILKKTGPDGKILGIDKNLALLKETKKNLEKRGFGVWLEGIDKKEKRQKARVILVNGDFSLMGEYKERYRFENVFGILFDLGVSFWHLKKSKKGFSFLREEPLDMRYTDKDEGISAKEIVNKFSQKEIETILKEYGQERFAKRISEEIVKERKKITIETTSQLVEIVKKAVPLWYQKRRIHPATKTFMALRIVVNDELNCLKRGLKEALKIVQKKGKIVVISFHSLEDRIIKNFFKEKEKEKKVKILTKKPIVPSPKEITRNYASRSAKLRAILKI